MEHTCSNDEQCGEFFYVKMEDRKNRECESIDKDKYSTMYKETFTVTCPHCGNSQEEEDEYWENDETGDIDR